MTVLTEAEARTKWCPLSRVQMYAAMEGDNPAVNRQTNDTHCIASGCMAWRQTGQVGIGPNGEKRNRDMDGRTKWVGEGFCGAFPLPVTP